MKPKRATPSAAGLADEDTQGRAGARNHPPMPTASPAPSSHFPAFRPVSSSRCRPVRAFRTDSRNES